MVKSNAQQQQEIEGLQSQIATPKPQITEGEISVIRIFASAGEAVAEKELVTFLNKPTTEIKYCLGSLDKLGLA